MLLSSVDKELTRKVEHASDTDITHVTQVSLH